MSAAERTSDDVVPHYEAGDGPLIAAHLHGHVDLEVAHAIFWAWGEEHDHAMGLIRRGGPRHTHLRQVPRDDDWMEYVICGPGRGASPITYVEQSSPWDAQPCINWPRCHRRAVAGVPVGRFTNPPAGADYVYYCRAHYRDFDRRWREATEASS